MTMSEKPISVADHQSDATWCEADLEWERWLGEAFAAMLAENIQQARRQIGDALALAQHHCQTGDPRLAVSLALHAWLLQEDDPKRARSLFLEAGAHWGQSLAWLDRQPPPRRLSRSSMFHLRLESKHPGRYRERRHEDMKALLAKGKALTERLRDRGAVAPWSRLAKPTGPDNALAFDTYGKIKKAIAFLPDDDNEPDQPDAPSV